MKKKLLMYELYKHIEYNNKLFRTDRARYYDYNGFSVRSYYNNNVSWCVPTDTIIDEMVKFINSDTCLEIAAGRGLLSYFLRKKKCEIDFD